MTGDSLGSGRRWRRWLPAAVMVVAAFLGATDGSAEEGAPPPQTIPLGEHLGYNIRYLGIHCGTMSLDSFADPKRPGISHIVLEARTSKFFDGIYRVRVRIEAEYDAVRGSSLSYRHHGQEKSDTKDELWLVDFEDHVVRRNRDDSVDVIPFKGERVLDPLSYLYRMRALLSSPGDRATLPMMTSDGDVDTVAEVTAKRTEGTPFGKREVLIVQPHPAEDEMFSKKGKLEIWVGADDDALPYRVVFDLPFGKLVAKLVRIEAHSDDRDPESGEEI